ncbi:MAG: hypothetical protein IKL78_02875 [Lachnospiraceae bacterium]|nr:hypothetical protein [Lachnospiraceae bacterium]
MKNYKIADLVFGLDLKDELLHPSMADFLYVGNAPVTFTVTTDTDAMTHADAIEFIKEHEKNRLILSNYMMVMKAEWGYRFYYQEEPRILCCDVDTTANHAVIHLSTEPVTPVSRCHGCAASPSLSFTDYIFYILRDIFFTFAPWHNMIPVHSSTIIYNSRAYVFSARSGTGKTTHTNLWIEHFNVDILDGDVTMLSLEDDGIFAYGMPWCGTSMKYQNKKVPLGGIVFLSQAKENTVTELSAFDGALSLMARSFAPTWTKELSSRNCFLSEQVAANTLCLHLACLPNREAALLVKEYIDRRLSGV